jgi:hypothetical protein
MVSVNNDAGLPCVFTGLIISGSFLLVLTPQEIIADRRRKIKGIK